MERAPSYTVVRNDGGGDNVALCFCGWLVVVEALFVTTIFASALIRRVRGGWSWYELGTDI